MQEIESLIEKFWAGNATGEEKRRLQELMLTKGKQWQQLLEQAYRAESDRRSSDTGEMGLHRLQPAAVLELEELHRQIESLEGSRRAVKGRPAIVRRILGWAAAAAIVGGFALGIYLLSAKRVQSDVLAHTVVNPSPVQYINDGKTVQHIQLRDGTAMDLYPGSSASCNHSFGIADRNLRLDGKALFKVQKKADAPFTVYAKGLATVVLGTKFLVNAAEDSNVSVLLMEGKIYVHALPECGMTMKDIYLAPGEELAVNIQSKNYIVSRERKADTVLATNGIRKPTARAGAAYVCVFDKTPLDKVFKRLSIYYKVRIVFKEDPGRKTFSGKIMRTDDLQVALSAICNTNDLTFRSDSVDIIISKKE